MAKKTSKQKRKKKLEKRGRKRKKRTDSRFTTQEIAQQKRYYERLEVYAEVLLSAIGVEINDLNINRSTQYFRQALVMMGGDNVLGNSLDSLFMLATRDNPSEGEKKNQLIEMEACMTVLRKNLENISKNSIAKVVWKTDNLEQKLLEGCEPKRQELIECARKVNGCCW